MARLLDLDELNDMTCVLKLFGSGLLRYLVISGFRKAHGMIRCVEVREFPSIKSVRPGFKMA